MAKICERFASGEGTIGRFFSAMAGTYRKNENMTKKRSEGGFLEDFKIKLFIGEYYEVRQDNGRCCRLDSRFAIKICNARGAVFFKGR